MHVYSAPQPNYLVDEMAASYFDQISEEEDLIPPDRKSWKERTAAGKAEYNMYPPPLPRKKLAPPSPPPVPAAAPATTTAFRPYQPTTDYFIMEDEVVIVQPYPRRR